MILRRSRLVSLLLLFFLLVHIIPFYDRSAYKIVMFYDYGFILPLFLLVSINLNSWTNPIKSLFFLALIFLSFLLLLFGYAGSISALILSSSVPFFILNNVKSYKQLIEIFYLPIKTASIVIIFMGIYLFLITKDQLLNFHFFEDYFVIASINYASLLLYGFSVLFFLIYYLKEKYIEKPSTFDFFLGLILISLSIFFSFVYLTRSTSLASLVVLALYLRRHSSVIIICIIIGGVLNSRIIFENINIFLGSNNVVEVANDFQRIDSVIFLIKHAVSFDYDLSNHMSYSSLANLLFCLFPLSLFFLKDIILAYVNTFKVDKIYLLLLAVANFIIIYQMDFFSVFVFFVLVEVISFEKRNKNCPQLG